MAAKDTVVDEIIMKNDVINIFVDLFEIDDVGMIWRREFSVRYQRLLEQGYIEFITEKDIDSSIGRDSNNLRRRVTKSMVEGKLYIRISELGRTILAFNEL